MALKYKAGDQIRIKSIDWYNENKDEYGNIDISYDFTFYADRSKYCGKVFTIDVVFDNCYTVKEDNHEYYWTDEMIEGLVEKETKFGTASNPLEIKSNANCLARERVDALATKIDKELPSGNQYVWELPDGYQFTDENGNVINATKVVLEKKGKEYPKTYEECCEIIGFCSDTLKWDNPFSINRDTHPYIKHLDNLLESFCKLIICRDAYWKIAGDWRPEFRFGKKKYCIMTKDNKVISATVEETNRILAFPTAEMRDAFYENFKKEIEICKELL